MENVCIYICVSIGLDGYVIYILSIWCLNIETVYMDFGTLELLFFIEKEININQFSVACVCIWETIENSTNFLFVFFVLLILYTYILRTCFSFDDDISYIRLWFCMFIGAKDYKYIFHRNVGFRKLDYGEYLMCYLINQLNWILYDVCMTLYDTGKIHKLYMYSK